jgi:hypothetical protein
MTITRLSESGANRDRTGDLLRAIAVSQLATRPGARSGRLGWRALVAVHRAEASPMKVIIL